MSRTKNPDLSPKERRIVLLVAEGLTNREIATRVGRAENTIKSHLRRIFVKTGARSRTDLVNRTQLAPRYLTTVEVVDLLNAARADLDQQTPPMGSAAWYRRDGAVTLLTRLIDQIGQQ